MLKFESVAKVGQFIKAMDFRPMEGREDSFVIGKILREDYRGGFMIECRFDTEGQRVGAEVFVPFEMGFTEWDDRVQYVSDGAFNRIIGKGGLV
tara:strand:- start:615 stop:896 length:282 start_codon:yes stop_codon:yes gene_type:complete